jgi:thiosulfate dehydrogenase (quinone) large subunit
MAIGTWVQRASRRSAPWRADPAWLLLPQRLFLGGTFAYAGLDKLADEAFFDPAAPTSIHAQLAAVRDTSPLAPLLGPLDAQAGLLGVLMALGELAVGLATLLGVRAREAAAGGALISLSLLLTVTWTTRPYYYGSDIVFLVCWLPLVVLGDGGRLSLEAALARRAGRREVPGRRALLARAAAMAAVAGLGGTTALVAWLTRRPTAADPGPEAADPGAPATGGGRLAALADVPVGGALAVTLPGSAGGALLVRPSADRVVAFSRTCTHAGCAVDIGPDGRTFRCPCHAAVFDAATGNVLAGPAPAPLPPVPVRVNGPDVVAG